MSLEVVRPGALTTIQDRGRIGWAHLGVPRSGALDRPALDRANALVGQGPEHAGLEITLTGCVLLARAPLLVAVTGAAAKVAVDGAEVDFGIAVPVPEGARLTIGSTRTGVRTYLAVRGGIDVPPVLGSRSTDTLSGLGPAVLRAGDHLPIGPSPLSAVEQAVRGSEIVLDSTHVSSGCGPAAAGSGDRPPIGSTRLSRAEQAARVEGEPEIVLDSTGTLSGLGPAAPRAGDHLPTGPSPLSAVEQAARVQRESEIVVDVVWGPRDGWFTADAVGVLLTSAYTVSPQSNRVGARLIGAPLTRANAAELPSEGLVAGAVQVTPDGQPIVFLADHPTTGGYPVIGVVGETGLNLLAQARPGSTVRFDGSQR